MDDKKRTIEAFYRSIVGTTVTVYLVSGQTINGVVLDADAGDLLLQRVGYEDYVFVPRSGMAALSTGSGKQMAVGAAATSSAEGSGEALPLA